jgi:hypothetical protein
MLDMKKIVRLTESDLNKIVRRVLKESKEDFIKKVSKSIKQPYIKDLMNMGIPKEYWEDIFSKIFNEKVGIRHIIQMVMNPSYPYGMTEDEREERVMDWGEIIVWGEGDIGDTDNNILISFLCVDEEEYENNEVFFVGDLNIGERFLNMVHTINPNLSRSDIISIIEECFLDVYQNEVSREIVINSVRVVQL